MPVIDWARIAEPQRDQYDSRVVLEFAQTRTSPRRRTFYTRRPAGDAPTIFDGAVAVRHIYADPAGPEYSDAPLDHPNIALAVDYLRYWPDVFRQFPLLIDTFHPITDKQVNSDDDFEMLHMIHGSTSGCSESMFGTVFATVYCPIGLAEAWVHEMGHQKLRALGISFEETTGLITNSPSELYVSPLRRDRLRPMSAVFHAEYSYTYVTNLDVLLTRAATHPLKRAALLDQLAMNVARIKEGIEVIKQHIKVDRDGERFVAGFIDWNDRVIREADGLLEIHRNGTHAHAHPAS